VLDSCHAVTFTFNADDPRTIRALELAAEADSWLKGRNRDGEDVYGVPSQSLPGRYYVVTRSSCDCPDFRHAQPLASSRQALDDARACKHILAVRLHAELVRAEHLEDLRTTQRRRGGHLTVVSRAEAGGSSSAD
jgi:SWIM zinc finger